MRFLLALLLAAFLPLARATPFWTSTRLTINFSTTSIKRLNFQTTKPSVSTTATPFLAAPRNSIKSTTSSIKRPNHQNSKPPLLLSTITSIRGGAGAPSLIPSLVPSTQSVDSFLNAMDLVGTAVFAFSGALTAGKKGMDLLGMLIVATITSCGGGTLRDLLLDSGTVFWMKDPLYLQICVGVTFGTFLLWPTLEQKLGWKGSEVPVCTADAVGLAAFAVLGAQKAARHELHPIMWIVSGLMSSCFGGVIRDLLCLQQPRIMYPHRTMYGPAPVVGSALYAGLVQWTSLEPQVIACTAFAVTFLFRVNAFSNSNRMPHWTS